MAKTRPCEICDIDLTEEEVVLCFGCRQAFMKGLNFSQAVLNTIIDPEDWKKRRTDKAGSAALTHAKVAIRKRSERFLTRGKWNDAIKEKKR